MSLKIILQEYARLGGVIIVLAQQYGSHYEKVVPLPEGSSLKALGWREDQSCFSGSAYHKTLNNVPHPIFSGAAGEVVNVGVDGYFSTIPAEATVLLRRKMNQEPVMISYPYGEGTVILTSLFSDYANAHSQMSGIDEAHIVRDLLTYARNVKREIPSWLLTGNQLMTFSLPEVDIHNDTEVVAAKAKFRVLSPDYARTLYTVEQTISIDLQATGSAALAFSFTPNGLYEDLLRNWIGIFHVEVELYDAAGNLIQPFTESDGGRFAIHMNQGKYNPGQGVLRWLTVQQEDRYLNQNVELDVHFRNTSDQAQTIDIPDPFLNVGHGGDGPSPHLGTPIYLEIPAGEERIFHASIPMAMMGCPSPPKNASYPVTFRFVYYTAAGALSQIGAAKVVFLKAQTTNSNLTVQDAANSFKNMSPINYVINSTNWDGTAQGKAKIKLVLDKNVGWQLYQETETAYETEHDFTANGTFQYSGQFTPVQTYNPGAYRLRLIVTTADDSVETRTQQFYYVKSNVSLTLAVIPEAYQSGEIYNRHYSLIPGQTYSVKFALGNGSGFAISQGRYIVTLKSENGTEVFRKEVANIALAVSQWLNVSEPMVFSPVAGGKYTLKIEYTDESRTAELATIAEGIYSYMMKLDTSSEQASYRCLDTANIHVNIMAVGAIHIKLTDIYTGVVQERDIDIPAGQQSATEIFQVPIALWYANAWKIVKAEITDSSGYSINDSAGFQTTAPLVAHSALADKLGLKEGSPLNLTLKFTEKSGVTASFPATLSVASPGLGFSDSQNVTIQLGITNEFNYQIPVAETVTDGVHAITYQLTIGGYELTQGSTSVQLPPIALKFSEPPASVNAGASFDLQVTNGGGRPGSFALAISLTDEAGKQVLTHEENLILTAGEMKTVTLTVPDGLKSGRYILYQMGTHTASGRAFEASSGITLSGLTATLNAYTLKEKYFDNEIVAGKAEIMNGALPLANATLAAKIKRMKIQSVGGITPLPTGSGYLFNNTWSGAMLGNDHAAVISAAGLLDVDLASGQAEVIIEDPSEGNSYEYYLSSVRVAANGDLWVTSAKGVYLRPAGGSLRLFTKEEIGLGNLTVYNEIHSIAFRGQGEDTEVWIGTNNGGIAIYANGAWTIINYQNGLPVRNVKGLAADGQGGMVVWSYNDGFARYDGTQWIAFETPFLTTTGDMKFFGDRQGDIWVAKNYPDYILFRWHEGSWQQWEYSTIGANLNYIDSICDGEDGVFFNCWENGEDVSSLCKAVGETFSFFHGCGDYYAGNIFGDDTRVVFTSLTGLLVKEGANLRWVIIKTSSIDYTQWGWSPPLCLAGDSSSGKLWIGHEEGISMLENNKYKHIFFLPDGRAIGTVNVIAVQSDHTVLAVSSHLVGVIQIQGETVSFIELPYNDTWENGISQIAREVNGRYWVITGEEASRQVWYFEGSEWHLFLSENLESRGVDLQADPSGGIWLVHGGSMARVNADLTITEYPLQAISGSAWPCITQIRVVPGADGNSSTVWGCGTTNSASGYEHQTGFFQFSFDGQSWRSWHNPIIRIAANDAGNMVMLGDSPDSSDLTIYKEDGMGGFAADDLRFFSYWTEYEQVIFALAMTNTDIYTFGFAYWEWGEEGGPLLRLTGGVDLIEEIIWQGTQPVTATAGETLSFPIETNQNLASGNYILSAELISTLDQKLASSDYGFIVRSAAVSASINRSGSSDINVRSGNDATIQLEVLNNTAEDKPALNLKVSKVSPAGVETVLQDGALSLNAGQNHAENLTFNESETGIWKLSAIVSEAGTELDAAELSLDVSAPAVAHEIISPEYAGDGAFPVKIRLANTGKIAVNMHVAVEATGGSPSYLNEDVALAVGEERILSFSDTITTDRVYDIAFTGDLAANEQKTVKYGYVGNLSLTVLPQYREGTVTMGYTVANAGGLPFSDTLHFELYAVGNAVAIYAVDKTYNLYPGAEAGADALEFSLLPGSYQLRWTSGHSGAGTSDFSILPAGIGQLAFAPAAKYPLGLTDFAYTLINSDTVAGSIPLLIEIVPAAGGAAVHTLNRSHYLEAGASVSDNFSFDFNQIGSYVVRISGAKVSGGAVGMPVKVLNLDEVAASVTVQPVSDGSVPALVNVADSGYNDFTGTLVIEAGGLRHEEPLQVLSEATLNQTFTFDTNGLSSGSQEVIAYLYDAAGNILSQNTLTVTVKNADIKISEVPQNLAIAAGSFANVTLKVKNQGNKRGEAAIAMTAFDTLNETRNLVLEAGEELELNDIYIDVDGDIPTGHYPFNYTLSGLGVTNGLAKGNFNFQVNGIALNVSAALDRSLYNQGETAQLTIDVSSADAVTTPLEAVVNWNEFSERRAFTLDSGSNSMVFEIPLTEASDAKVFYGIYQQEGRGIYLNDIYLNFAGNVSVTLDQQVYDPGDSIHALFAVNEAGTLTAECFGTSQTVAVGTSTSIDFVVPADALGGSYGMAWTFTPTDPTHASASGSKAFDVSGLVVKVAKAELERGKYAPGDTIKAMLTLESNRDITLSLRSWTTTPEAQWTYLGEQSVTLAAASQTPAILEYAFVTTEAGTHRFVYGLYRGEQLVVSGAAAFDCGDAVLIGLAPDHLEYANGNETVKVKADYFGSGTASLRLYLDDVLVDEKSITLSGLGSMEIDLAATQISGGRHDLRAVMTKDGLTSARRAWFTYGTNLPDLAVGVTERSVNALDYVFTIRVENSGKTAAAATTLIFSDNDSDTGSAAIAALAPGAYQDAQFTWSGSGKAGSHILRFAADCDNAIKEFAEANNVLEINEEVPALFYKLEIDPLIWTGNSNVSIFSRFINNQAGDLPLLLHLTLTHNASSQVVLDRNKNVSLIPFVQTVETDVFNTGTYPAGDYMLTQTASGDDVDRSEELSVYIEPTKIISGSMTAVPTMIAAGIDAQVTLKLSLSNGGNVALESETLAIEVANKESQLVVKTDSLSVSLALGETKDIDHILALNLVEGVYTVTLKYAESVIAEVEITAAMGLEKEKYVSHRPRVLIMNTLQLLYLNQKNFLKSILSAAGIAYQDTANLIESYFHNQKSEHNINVVFGNLLAPNLKKELKERVQRGEGLIYIADNAVSDGVLKELSGVKVRNLLLTLWEKEITLLPGLLGNGGTAMLTNKCKFGLEVLADGVQVLAETKNNKKPIMAYRQYGLGKVLTLCAPLNFTSGGDVFAQLLLNAVTLFNNEIFSSSDLTRVMPIELRIKNNTGAAKTFRVQELIPQTATAYGFDPQPLAGDGVKWDVNLAVDEEKVISYWLQLPDVVGTYDIKSEIYEGDQKIDEALLTFEVVQKVSDRVVGIMAEINAGGDAQAQLALPLLQNIAGRTGSDALSLWLNLRDAVQAADLMAASESSEASVWRQKLQNVMLACARIFYDKVKDFTPPEMTAFGTRFQE